MNFVEEDQFNAQFQERLKRTREELDMTQAQMASHLRIPKETYKKYESRPRSSLPLYLLPRLVFVTGRPHSYWLGTPQRALRVVK